MKSLSTLFLICIALALADCATAPAPLASRRSVPSDRIFASALLARSSSRSASFKLTRDTGYAGSATGIDVFLDGQRVARLATSETIAIYVTPGSHLLGARFSWGPIPPTEREFTASSERPLKIRVTTEAYSSNLDLKPESGLLTQ